MKQNQNIKLSICVPTYNFGNYIDETLSCIIDQLVPGVEIVVLDGASTDNTQEIVTRYKNKCESLVYYRQDFKGGIDADIAKAVSLCHGDYCWLFSSDDLIIRGAIQRILSEIESGYDIYLCNRAECDVNMIPIRKLFWFKNNVGDKIFKLHNENDLLDYFESSGSSLGTLFSYMSSIIFKRNRWNEIADKEFAVGTCYAHAYILFSLAHTSCILKYIRDSLVLCRFGNDSFSNNGYIKRVAIDFDGYDKISEKLFSSNPDVMKSFKKVVRKHYPFFKVSKIKALSANNEWQELKPKLLRIGFTPLQIFFCEIMGKFKNVFLYLVKLKHFRENYFVKISP